MSTPPLSSPPATQASPLERLAISRRAIVRSMNQTNHSHDEEEQEDAADEARQRDGGGGTWGLVKHTLSAWWRHHPANVALDFAKPAFGHYAREQPLKLLGIAAAVGAAAVVIKPWKLFSVTGLALAALKSSQMTGVLLSLLSSHNDGPHKQDPR